MVREVTRYLCDICHNSYPSHREAEACEAQCPPPPVLGKGAVFSNTPFPDTTFYIIIKTDAGITDKHNRRYSAITLIRYNGNTNIDSYSRDIVVEKDGQRLKWNSPAEEAPRRISDDEISALCRDDKVFRETVERVTRGE